jgi:sorting nexin-8
MFNAPRPAQRYSSTSGNTGLGGSFVDENPLGGSVYDDGLDPWSAAPSPSPPQLPTAPSLFSSVIADATVPAVYNKSFAAVDSTNSGETSVNALTRVLQTSHLPATTIDKIVNLVSSRARVSKLEFYVALALVALAQAGKDVSIEQVAALASQNTLPEPSLDLSSLQPSTSDFTTPTPAYRPPAPRSPAPNYTTDDPWNTARFTAEPGNDSLTNGAPSSLSGTGLPKDWWKKQETVNVNILGQQGFILNRYTVYEIISERGAPVPRRYSEFVFLWDCLVRRYPFRLLPALPPKRIQPDEQFLEQRRMGLKRFINFVVNHPVIKDDGLLAVFLTEPSFEAWRKHASISVEEESASKRVDRVEEMTIPSDLEEKLTIVRQKITSLIEQWQRICILAERIIKRREAAAVRIPSGLRRNYLALPLFSSSPSSPTLTLTRPVAPDFSSASSIFSASTIGLNFESRDERQADLSRLTNILNVVVEVNERCWRGDDCELCDGVRHGVEQVALHTQAHSDLLEQRTHTLLYNTLDALKSQRDLYIATRDLFIRHVRLSIDQVERLKKRVESNSSKLEGVKAAKKDGWETEVDRFIGLIERDQATIAAQLNRRIFIRACLWHELRVVLHNRENTLLTQAIQAFASEEQTFVENVSANWVSLGHAVESMPFE